MANRYHNKLTSASPAPNPGSMGGKSRGVILNDTESDPPYNANIGPGGPDMNVVGFDRVKCFVKAKMSPFMGVGQENPGVQQGTPMQPMAPAPMVSNIEGTGQQALSSRSDISGNRN